IDTFTYMAKDASGATSSLVTVSVTVGEAGDSSTVSGSNKADVFVDVAGRDTTYRADNGNDVAFGGDGADKLYGENGDDILFGGAGRDLLDGGNGGDILVGGAGNDVLTGGNGSDIFVLSASGGRDVITDFKPENDRILAGYAGPDTDSAVNAYIRAAKPGANAFTFADFDLEGDGKIEGVLVTGGSLGTGSLVLSDWTVAALVGQKMLTGSGQMAGDWIV
ncbi:MAG TPA: hypothetical protein VIT92_05320, partial [Burkholderiaceae bacterium]